MKKKVIAMLMVMLMVVAMLPVVAHAGGITISGPQSVKVVMGTSQELTFTLNEPVPTGCKLRVTKSSGGSEFDLRCDECEPGSTQIVATVEGLSKTVGSPSTLQVQVYQTSNQWIEAAWDCDVSVEWPDYTIGSVSPTNPTANVGSKTNAAISFSDALPESFDYEVYVENEEIAKCEASDFTEDRTGLNMELLGVAEGTTQVTVSIYDDWGSKVDSTTFDVTVAPAPQVVKSIDVNFTYQIGTTFNDLAKSASITADLAAAIDSENPSWEMDILQSADGSTWTNVWTDENSGSKVLEEGMQYRFFPSFDCEDGYAITDATVVRVNGVAATKDGDVYVCTLPKLEQKPADPVVPKTGDDSLVWVCLLSGAVALAGAAVVLERKSRHQQSR